MTTISYMGANLVAQQLDWSMTGGWMQGDRAANDHYAPMETFPERFAAFVRLVTESGFDNLDVWTGQLNWSWATPAHLAAAREVIEHTGVSVTSYAGLFGDTVEEFTAAAAVATALGAPILSGNAGLLGTDRASLVELLQQSDLVLAIENHPESSASEVLEKIGDGAGGRIGTAVDTGWWGTNGVDAAQVLRELAGHVVHVHLKDIRAAGAHETCALGDGVVPVAECVAMLPEIGFTGPISIEHEPEHNDPAAEVAISRTRLLDWLHTARAPR